MSDLAKVINPEEAKKQQARDKVIVRTSIIGIIANVGLAAFKAAVGAAANSVAILMDAVNNLSDAGSSLITIIGAKLSGKPADKKHPWGYGRIEYLSAMIISVIVLYAGITSLQESVKKIIHPETPDYTAVSLVIVAVAVAVKILLGRYVKAQGKKTDSDSLVNSGQDALLDSVISASTLAAALIYMASGISLEAWLGAVIAAVIIKSGIEMLRDTLSQILGERADPDLDRRICRIVTSFPEVSGAYDLILNDYGPGRFSGSVHIEVPDTMTADEIDVLIRRITDTVYLKEGVILTGVGLYSVNTKDDAAARMRRDVMKLVMKHKGVLQVHGFYVDEKAKRIRFDVVISFDVKDRIALYQEIVEEVKKKYPGYTVIAALDTDFSLSE